jgi:hypothetical protein
MSAVVETFQKVDPILIRIALDLLPRLKLEDEQMLILSIGLPHLEILMKNDPLLLQSLTELFDLINPFEFNCVYITKNGGHHRVYDDKQFGKKATISFGDWTGNKLLIDNEHVSDHNRLVVYDGTVIISETTVHNSGIKYNITFYNVKQS